MKGYITYYNPVLGTIYLTALTFINFFPTDYTYNKEQAKLFDEYTYKQVSRTYTALKFITQ